MLQEDSHRRDDAAEELLRRALLDDSSSVAVSLTVSGLPVSEAVTVIFHGRRDLGTLQTYITSGSRTAGATVAANELLRVPCDLDLAEAEDRAEAEQLYLEQATALLHRLSVVGDHLTVGKLAEAIGLDYPRHQRAWTHAWLR